jgi:hypothetical protein
MMSKIFITGMTAPQVSEKAHKKSLSYAGVIKDVLEGMGHTVVWGEPNLVLDESSLAEFDSVLVGLAPITSLGANRAYGALTIIDALWSSSKLSFFIDAPTVSQIGVSLRATLGSPENLTKDFFSYRKHYAQVLASQEIQSKILSAIDKLLTQDWPLTYYSALPWGSDDSVYKSLPSTVGSCLVALNVDAFLDESSSGYSDVIANKWVYDIPTPHWTKKQLKMVSLPGSPMKMNKGYTDHDVYLQISRSVGAMISPDRRQGTWWTYRYMQALNAGIPVVTEWKESAVLGPSWTVLAATIEEMTLEDRRGLAKMQKKSYLEQTPSKIEVTKLLNETMKL